MGVQSRLESVHMRSIKDPFPERSLNELEDMLKRCRNDREIRRAQRVLLLVKND